MSLIPSLFDGNQRRSRSNSSLFSPFSLEAWDPFNRCLMMPLSNEVSRIEWKETPEAHLFKVDIPGLMKEEVKVEVVEGRILQISGEINREKEEINTADKCHRFELSTNKFIRRFKLPENARLDGMRTTMKNGVLTVTVPKAVVEVRSPQSKSNTIQIAG